MGFLRLSDRSLTLFRFKVMDEFQHYIKGFKASINVY